MLYPIIREVILPASSTSIRVNKARLVRGAIHWLSRLSLKHAQRLGSFLGRILYWTRSDSARITRINISRCFPELSAQQQEVLARQSLRHTGMLVAELGAMWEWPVERSLALVKEVTGTEHLTEAEKKGNGLILLAPHLGNWELAGLYFAARYRMAALYQPPKISELDEYMRAVRERNGSELVPASKRGVMRLFHILREQGVIGILPDQNPEASGGHFAPFFGIPANTIKLVSKLVEKTNAQVLCVCAERLDDHQGFVINIVPADSALYAEDLSTSVAALNRTVETMVRQLPEQYQWEYKRFKKRPDGSKHFYR